MRTTANLGGRKENVYLASRHFIDIRQMAAPYAAEHENIAVDGCG